MHLAYALIVCAATEEWDYEGQHQIMQVVVDGKGGCAFLRMSTNNIQSMVWLDSKGQVVYQSVVSNAVIFACTKKQVLFSDKLTGEKVKQVDDKGTVTQLSEPDGRVEGSLTMQYYQNTMADKKGFFAIKMVSPPRRAAPRAV